MGEVWRDVEGYKGLYKVSNIGNVKSFHSKEKVLKFGLCNGYHHVVLSKEGKVKTHTVRMLVADAFIPKKGIRARVKSINSSRTDNRVENLRWSKVEDTTKEEVLLIKRIDYFNRYLTKRQLEKALKLTPPKVLEERCWDYNALTGAFEWEKTYNGALYWSKAQWNLTEKYLKDE